MALTITSPGTNTVQITTSIAGAVYSSFADFAGAVSDAITGVNPVRTTGWSSYDTFTSGITYTQVFRSLNKDGTTYKNAILRWNTMQQEVNITTCETWDPINHIAQNEAWTYFDSSPIPYRLDSTDFLIFVNARWLMLHAYMANEPTAWAGVFETAREDVADTAANMYPCWGWISSSLWMLGSTSYSAKPLATNDYTLINFPRTRSGNTSFNAAKGYAADYGVAQYPHWLATTNGPFINYLGNQNNKFIANTWDVTKRLVMPIKPIADYTATNITNYGQIFGLKVLSPAGQNMNKIQVNADSDGNYTQSGTLSDHWILNNHHKYMSSDNASWFTNANWVATNLTVGFRPEFIASNGTFYYVTGGVTTNNLWKVNILLGTTTNISTTTSYYDIKFDGERYMYIGTANGLTRLDTRDDSLTNLAISGGVFAFAINATHIVCTPYTTSATPVVTRVLRSTFAVDSSNGSITLATFTESVRMTDALTDLDGNVHFVPAVATAANFKITKIVSATPASPIYATFYQTICNNASLQLLDSTNIVLWQSTTASNIRSTQYNPRLMSQTTSTNVGYSTGSTNQHKMTTAKIQGVLFACPRSSTSSCTNALLSLGNTITGSIGTPVMSVENYGTPLNMTYASANPFIFWDGARIASNFETGIRVWANVNGANIYNGVTVGQVAILA